MSGIAYAGILAGLLILAFLAYGLAKKKQGKAEVREEILGEVKKERQDALEDSRRNRKRLRDWYERVRDGEGG